MFLVSRRSITDCLPVPVGTTIAAPVALELMKVQRAARLDGEITAADHEHWGRTASPYEEDPRTFEVVGPAGAQVSFHKR